MLNRNRGTGGRFPRRVAGIRAIDAFAGVASIASVLSGLTGGTPPWIQVKAGTVFLDSGAAAATEEGSAIRRCIRPGDNPITPAFMYAVQDSGTERPTLHLVTASIWSLRSDGVAGAGTLWIAMEPAPAFDGDYTLWFVGHRAANTRFAIGGDSDDNGWVIQNTNSIESPGGTGTFTGSAGLIQGYFRRSGSTAYFAASGMAEAAQSAQGGVPGLTFLLRETLNPTYSDAANGLCLLIAASRNYTLDERAAISAAMVAEFGCGAIP